MPLEPLQPLQWLYTPQTHLRKLSTPNELVVNCLSKFMFIVDVRIIRKPVGTGLVTQADILSRLLLLQGIVGPPQQWILGVVLH
jgi:hypothetical protein